MTIEFDCSGCKTPLRLPDEMAGTRAKCVQCGTVLAIPSPTEHFWPPGALQATASQAASSVAAVRSGQPAARTAVSKSLTETSRISTSQTATISKTTTASNGSRPAALSMDRPATAARPIVLGDDDAPQRKVEQHAHRDGARIRVGDVLQRACGIYHANLKSLAFAGVVVCALAAAVTVAAVFALQAMRAHAVVSFFVPQVLLIWLMLGAMALAMKTARGRRRSLATLFGEMPLYGDALTVWVLCFGPLVPLAIGCSLAGLSTPVVASVLSLASLPLAFVIWMPALLALVDHADGPIDALRRAARYAGRNLLPLACLLAISLGVLVGSALPLGLGLPLGVPFIMLLSTVAYLRDAAIRE